MEDILASQMSFTSVNRLLHVPHFTVMDLGCYLKNGSPKAEIF